MIDDETNETEDAGMDLEDYYGEEGAKPIKDFINAQLAAAKPQQPETPKPLSEAENEAVDDQILDNLIDGHRDAAHHLSGQRRQAGLSRQVEGAGYIRNRPELRVPRGTVGGPL